MAARRPGSALGRGGQKRPGRQVLLRRAGGLLFQAAIAQLGERQTEDLEVPSSILGHGILSLAVVLQSCASIV